MGVSENGRRQVLIEFVDGIPRFYFTGAQNQPQESEGHGPTYTRRREYGH